MNPISRARGVTIPHISPFVAALVATSVIACAAAAPAAAAQSAAQWVVAGRALLDSGKHDAAVKAFERAVKLEEQNAGHRVLLAQALGAVAARANIFRQPLLARRIKSELDRAVALDPRGLDARFGLLQYSLQAPAIAGGGESKARAMAAEIAALNRTRGHAARAQIAQHKRDTLTAEREYRAAVIADSDSALAYTQLASFLQNRRRSDEALATLAQLLARRPDDATGLYAFGRLAAITDRELTRGEVALRRFLTLPPDPTDTTRPAPALAHFRLGEILVKLDRKEEGRVEFEHALRLNPGMEAARRALQSR